MKTVPKKAKELIRGDQRLRWNGREDVRDEVLGVSEPARRHGDEGDWVYRIRFRTEGREWESVVSARDTIRVIVD